MSSFDILMNFISSIPNNTALISISPVIFFAIIYFLGRIHVSNYWQYHNDKHSTILHGIVAINNVIFVPIIIILLFFKFTTIISIGGFLLALLFLYDQYFSNKFFKFLKEKTNKLSEEKAPLPKKLLSSNFDMIIFAYKTKIATISGSIILYVLSYFVLTNNEGIGVLLITLFLNILGIIRFTNLDSMFQSRKPVNIELINPEEVHNNSKIIEFLNNGEFCKLENEKGFVYSIPKNRIKSIKLK